MITVIREYTLTNKLFTKLIESYDWSIRDIDKLKDINDYLWKNRYKYFNPRIKILTNLKRFAPLPKMLFIEFMLDEQCMLKTQVEKRQ